MENAGAPLLDCGPRRLCIAGIRPPEQRHAAQTRQMVGEIEKSVLSWTQGVASLP